MPSSYSNPFVSYLNRFITVSPEHEAAFDEFVTESGLSSNLSLRLETKTENYVSSRFQDDYPPSIILTGNAGDGKTYLCRKVIEGYTNQVVTRWDHSDWPIPRDGLTLRVVKDLSEVGDQSGASVLGDLQSSLLEERPVTVFLIAANEGRLRFLLNQPGLTPLRAIVDKQLADGADLENKRLIVLNLNQVTTSSYIQRTVNFFTAPQNWESCDACPAIRSCPIRFNARRLADRTVADRLRLLYQLLEQLDIHVTIRDMLIQLAFTISGGLTCEEVLSQRNQLEWQPHNYVYYENVWGNSADPAITRKITVTSLLQRLDVGRQARFEIDDFIINGAPDDEERQSEYDNLFAPEIDINEKQFGQDRADYLHGGAESPSLNEEHPLLSWLPHCRRKLFFEWSDTSRAHSLIPFLFLPTYLQLIEGDRGMLLRIKPDLVRGLNRAFSGLYVPIENALYVTSQYAHAVEQPVPVIRLKRGLDNISLEPMHKNREAFDCDQSALQLTVLHPRTGEKDAITWEINLLRFEYLMRLAQGETHNVLSEECELSIRQLKDRLLTAFGQSSEDDGHIEFFSVEQNRYVVKQLYIEEGKIRT